MHHHRHHHLYSFLTSPIFPTLKKGLKFHHLTDMEFQDGICGRTL